MLINKHTNPKKKILIACLAGALLLVGAIIITRQANLWPFPPAPQTTLTPATDEQKKDGEQTKTDTIQDTSSKETTGGGSDQPLPPVTDEATNTSTVIVDITSTSQDGTIYKIGVLIQAQLSSGQCNLTLKKGTQIYASSVDIQALPSTSTCKGFNVPLDQLSAGIWIATVDIDSGSINGTASREVTVQ